MRKKKAFNIYKRDMDSPHKKVTNDVCVANDDLKFMLFAFTTLLANLILLFWICFSLERILKRCSIEKLLERSFDALMPIICCLNDFGCHSTRWYMMTWTIRSFVRKMVGSHEKEARSYHENVTYRPSLSPGSGSTRSTPGRYLAMISAEGCEK